VLAAAGIVEAALGGWIPPAARPGANTGPN
jgi:hypothetical protein